MEFHVLGLGFIMENTIENGNGIKIWARQLLRRWDLCSWDLVKICAGNWEEEPPFRTLWSPNIVHIIPKYKTKTSITDDIDGHISALLNTVCLIINMHVYLLYLIVYIYFNMRPCTVHIQ
jgi:hypothetical protein